METTRVLITKHAVLIYDGIIIILSLHIIGAYYKRLETLISASNCLERRHRQKFKFVYENVLETKVI